ncbi:MAG: universal stress protein [Burkholderiales bacterium]|nr:universal stress protein [Burkholderiales bacterium]
MTYRNILLHIDARAQCPQRTDLALALAARLDAKVIGLATTGTLALPAGFGMAPSGELLAAAQDYLEQQAQAASARFTEAARRQAVACETRIVEGIEAQAVAQQSRAVDLIVVGQRDPGSDDSPAVDPGEVLMHAPRPVLVVPYIGAPAGLGGHALIAWNASREACRAVSDALPLLHLASQVTVMTINPDAETHGDVPGADIAAYLAHHGIRVELQVERTPVRDVGEDLLSRAADLGAGLVVMGAYGHSRAREWVFGGATRTMLRAMTVPVLLSH